VRYGRLALRLLWASSGIIRFDPRRSQPKPIGRRLAERVGFEPTVRQRRTTVFKTAAFDRSATSPVEIKIYEKKHIFKMKLRRLTFDSYSSQYSQEKTTGLCYNRIVINNSKIMTIDSFSVLSIWAHVHFIFVGITIIGAIFFVIWGLKHFKKDEIINWAIIFLVIGLIGLIVSAPAASWWIRSLISGGF
jgi:hypothetical protein